MIKKIMLLAATLMLVGACSSSGGDVVKAINDGLAVPPPTSEMTEPKSLAVDVPAIATATNYYGKYDLTLGEEFTLNMTQISENKIYDLEYSATADIEINIDRFYGFFIGECSDYSDSLTWMEVDAEGVILSEEEANMLFPMIAKAGSRYLLRVNYTNTNGCDQVSSYLTLVEAE